MSLSYLGLLAILVTLLVIQPVLVTLGPAGRFLVDGLISLVLVAAIATSAGHPRLLRVGIALAIPAFLARASGYVVPSDTAAALNTGLTLLFLAFTTVTILSALMRAREISGDTISGGVCVYLLMGVAWAMAYALVEQSAPGSISGLEAGLPADPRHPSGGELTSVLYLSFVTLTTLGYGDITPVSQTARMLTTLEAIVGQLFIAIFIARLVGLYIAQRKS